MLTSPGWSRLALALPLLLSLAGCREEKPAEVDADRDGDGYAAAVDCDDLDAARSPGVAERCDDVDNDCDGEADELGAVDGERWYLDADGDGLGAEDVSVLACAPPEGWVTESGDCDDLSAAIGPGRPETCDGLDDDCDGLVDEPGAVDGMPGYWDGDADGSGDPAVSAAVCAFGDGWVSNRLDCDDEDPTVWTGSPETCDGLDNDCDGLVDIDAVDGEVYYPDEDGDRYGDPDRTVNACSRPSGYVAGAGDCDDGDAGVHEGADERCDGVDEDCDGEVDELALDRDTWYLDADADGYGVDDSVALACEDPWGGGSLLGGDCDDADADVSPGADEIWYDGLDQDCAADSDWDADGDGYVTDALEDEDEPTLDPGSGLTVDAGESTEGGDCDDEAAAVNPGQEETCDALDQDCDGEVDEEASDATSWTADEDGDGYGVNGGEVLSCSPPAGSWSALPDDCDDADAAVNPGVDEIWYDGLDQDCGRDSDWDADRDGYVTDALDDPDEPTYDPGSGAIVDHGVRTGAGDCDDAEEAISPAADEICDSVDQDCDGVADDEATDAATWYADADADGWGSETDTLASCERPDEGWLESAGDCDDTDAAVSPDAEETWYDGLDQDCGRDSDWDADLDGYVTDALEDEDEPTYDPGTGEVVESGTRTRGGDCDDTARAVRPGATERCDGVDNDCDGEVDLDADGAGIWYTDADADGYGVDESGELFCADPGAGYADEGGDCDDAELAVSPGAVETCGDDDGVDNDCDGAADTACDEGWVRYRYGVGADPEDWSCDLRWDAVWAPSAESCDGCDWTFDVTLTYRPDESDNEGGCVDETDADLSWTLGVGYRVRLSEKLYQLEEDLSWTSWAWASLDTDTGRLLFHDGPLEEETDGLYETDYWQGSAELYALTR